jgi:hypothetical protein
VLLSCVVRGGGYRDVPEWCSHPRQVYDYLARGAVFVLIVSCIVCLGALAAPDGKVAAETAVIELDSADTVADNHG